MQTSLMSDFLFKNGYYYCTCGRKISRIGFVASPKKKSEKMENYLQEMGGLPNITNDIELAFLLTCHN
jgi:hypothetical protein